MMDGAITTGKDMFAYWAFCSVANAGEGQKSGGRTFSARTLLFVGNAGREVIN
jgi:hypothetical protein